MWMEHVRKSRKKNMKSVECSYSRGAKTVRCIKVVKIVLYMEQSIVSIIKHLRK